jgi:hypothetical protein
MLCCELHELVDHNRNN